MVTFRPNLVWLDPSPLVLQVNIVQIMCCVPWTLHCRDETEPTWMPDSMRLLVMEICPRATAHWPGYWESFTRRRIIPPQIGGWQLRWVQKKYIQTDTHTDRQTRRQADGRMCRLYRWTDGQMADGRTDGQTDRQRQIQTDVDRQTRHRGTVTATTSHVGQFFKCNNNDNYVYWQCKMTIEYTVLASRSRSIKK